MTGEEIRKAVYGMVEEQVAVNERQFPANSTNEMADWMLILAKVQGNLASAVLQEHRKFGAGRAGGYRRMRDELVQAIAVLVQMAECEAKRAHAHEVAQDRDLDRDQSPLGR